MYFVLNHVINEYLHTLPSSSACFWLSSMSTVSNVSFYYVWFIVVDSHCVSNHQIEIWVYHLSTHSYERRRVEFHTTRNARTL